METTEKFRRLPPLAGVHFAGFKDVKIESRQSVVHQLRNFLKYCLKEATSPAVQVILGEWGEGKTEVYQRYIRTTVTGPNCAYLVSASTVAQSLPKVRAESPLTSLNFLAAVFYAVRHEARADLVPPPERFPSIEQWVEETLKAYARRKMLVFIDEFEELILDPSALRAILSGLKELINKQYPPVTEAGQYPGIISFFLSCTPDAYARMQRDPDIAEIFGSWERRISKIQLVPVTRREGVKFLHSLMHYAYNDRLPEPPPIKDVGVFYTLQTIGRGNLGALVTLFVKAFNAAAIDDQSMYVIDGPRLLDILAGEMISVYGGTAKCIEGRLLESLEEILDEQEATLFRLLAGELRPFAISELMIRLPISDAAEMSALITRINRKVAAAGKANIAIASFVALREGLSFENVQEALQPELRENEIQVDGFARRLDELEDDLTFLELRDDRLVPRMLFPWDYRMISATFEGVTLESARRLERRIEKLVDQSEFFYRLSNELIFQLFPTPIPLGLEFIKDRDLRLKMWRDTTASFSQIFRDDMLRAFLGLIQYIEATDIKVGGQRTARDGLDVTVEDTSQNATIRCYCRAQYGDLGPDAVRQIEEGLREIGDAHLALVIHIGEVTDQGREEIRAREMENHLLLIPLHSSLAKRILIAYRCKTSHPDQVDDRLFAESVTRWFKAELELSRRVKEWLEQGVRAGIVLKDLYKATARGERDLADSLKFYINKLGEPDTPEKIFQANERLMGFVPFGSRVGFIPDIESAAQLERYTEDLAKNKFVRNLDRTVLVTDTPPEERLLRILERVETIAKSDIESYFVNAARAKRILEDVYLNILKHKGVIAEVRGALSLVKEGEALEQARSIRKECQELLTTCKREEEWSAFAHIFVTKQRAFRFITIPDLENYLDELYEAIQAAVQQGRMEVVLQRVALLTNLAQHLRTTLIPKVKGAISEARRIRRDTVSQVDSLLEDIEAVISQYNKWLKQNAVADNVKEVRELKDGQGRLGEICRTPITAEDLTEEEKKDGTFSHREWANQEQYFNVALRRVQESAKSLQQQVNRCRRVVDDIRRALGNLEQMGGNTRSRLLTIEVPEEYKLSKLIRIRLKTFLRDISAASSESGPKPAEFSPALTLGKMLEDLQEFYRPLNERYRKAERAINALQELVDAEAEFHSAVQDYSEAHHRLAEKVDVEPFQTEVRELGYAQNAILDEYKRRAFELSESEPDKIINHATIIEVKQETEQLVERLQEVADRVSQIWDDYVKECGRFVRSIQRVVLLVKKRDTSLAVDSVESKCKKLLGVARAQEWPAKPMSYYEATKREIQERVIELLKRTLDEAEGNILMTVVDKREQSESGWFNLSQIAQEVADERGISKAEAEELLRSLVRKGYLIEGIAIPV